jgi:Tol biopolymer transport system component
LKTNTLTSSPKISEGSRENLPNWSPDGKTLYYISAVKSGKALSSWVDARYDLLRIPFDPETLVWGDPDTLLTSKETGLSITWPMASPDGKYLVFCMIDHSYFSIFDTQSDLYILDLTTKKYRKLDVLNSSTSESYHTWSKNGRWMVFSSKRMDELSTRPHFAYFDSAGNFSQALCSSAGRPSLL